ncbi:uncharacterized protein [Amphiura filiformis]|uniref:uncharacterized protein n=1 Tax=Amphiura filiformis TaxID=82378 RepID=UPI003B2105A3
MAAGATRPTEANFYGGWRICKVEIHVKDPNNTSGLEGVEFCMSDSGDLTWNVPRNAGATPYFAQSFDLYEVQGSKLPTVKFFGGISGETIELNASLKRGDRLTLQYEHSFTLHCEKVLTIDRAVEEPFSFLNAFREGYFSDLVIKADTGKKFQVHKTILEASCPNINWSQTPPPLTNTPEEALATILHFMYAECLPDEMTEEKARQCMKIAGKLPGLEKLLEQCESFVQNIAVKNQIITLINDMHSCADRITDIFSGQIASSNPASNPASEATTTPMPINEDNLLAEPAKFCYACKQAAREAAVASAKFLTICDLFARRRTELSRAERHEIIKYAKSRLPVFVKQINKFLEVLREQHSKRLSSNQRQELALYLVPEIDSTLEILTKVIRESKDAIEEVLRATSAEGKQKKSSTGDYLHKTVKQAMHLKELMKLKTLHDKASEFFASLQWKKQSFELLTHDEKIFSIVKNMEQMLEEFPHMLRKVEKIDMRVNDGLTMKNFKFVFKMGTSRVSWGLEKAADHKPALQPVLQRLCALVHRESFNTSLLQLGLLDPASQQAAGVGGEAYLKMFTRASSTARPMYQPKVLESLSIPPSPGESKLAKVMSQLLASGKDSDMCFEIVSVKDEPSDIVVDHTQGGNPIARQEDTTMEEISLIKAHRVVIASRCDWFRRALLSGMRESIDRKIEVHDADPNLFRQFLGYLYSGGLETSAMSVEQLADMMSLSDRYEVDNLKQVCEAALKMRLDEDSVLFLLSLADQFHATILREAALNFIMEHPAVAQSDVYEELPEHLKSEVSNLVTWNKDEEPMIDGYTQFKGMQYDTDSDDSSDYGLEVKDLAKGLADARKESKRAVKESESDSDSSGEEVPNPLVEDHEQLHTCINQLKEILGDEVPREELERLSRAADFDVNRALNFFFAS